MPPYGSVRSPSLRKMDNSAMRHDGGNKRRPLSPAYIMGDPFALATLSIAIAAWLLAFVASIIADIEEDFPNYTWWSLVFMLCCILGVLVATAADAGDTYSVAIVGFLAAGLVFTTSSVNSLIYSPEPAKEAAAAGFILLSMVSIIWIFHYGSQPTASYRRYVDSFALHKGHSHSRNSRPISQTYNGRPDTTVISHTAPQMYTSNQLGGFETASPVSAYPGGALGGGVAASDQARTSHPRFGAPTSTASQHVTTAGAPLGGISSVGGDDPMAAPMEYPYRAKAIYSYEANPDDQNEISFAKHEILEVSDVSGRWWQAKKETGETGIAPSNYLILL